jgi:protease IV
MSDSAVPPPTAPMPPPRPAPPPPPRRSVFAWAFALSFLLNLLFGFAAILLCIGLLTAGVGLTFSPDEGEVVEHEHSGNASSKNKIVVVSVDGLLLEGLLDFEHKEIERAESDPDVKAVVLRINSPGGTITASDDLYRRLTELRWGKNGEKNTQKKPLVVSMGSIAASGGYYVAMPAGTVYADATSITGSIGVYAAFPNVKELGDKYGFKVNVIKQGEIKDSGSPFQEMSPHEREVWQDMVDHAYRRFLDVVEDGRAGVLKKGQLLERVQIDRLDLRPPPPPNKAPEPAPGPLERYRADGGIFTAQEAKDLNLIDNIGTLDDAIQDAAAQANVAADYRAIEYKRRKSPLQEMLGLHAPQPASALDPARLADGLMPRLWYLAPGSELSGVLAGMQAKPGAER